MLRCLLACALLLAPACYSPHYGDCEVTCTAAKGCPSGLTCDEQLGMCRTSGATGACAAPADAAPDDAEHDAPPDGATVDDVDGDGKLNSDDNCPTKANADQNDEDGDLLGDVCDPCPIDTNNDDPDGDQVGGSCDPHPSVGGDVMTFYGFGTWPLPGVDVEGTWTHNGGSLAFNNQPTALSRVLFAASSRVHRRVTAHFNISSVVSGGNYTGPVVDHGSASGATASGIGCVILAPQIQGLRDLALEGESLTQISNTTSSSLGPVTLTIVETAVNNWSCEQTGAALAGSYAHAADDPHDGAVTTGAMGTLDWVLIVTSP